MDQQDPIASSSLVIGRRGFIGAIAAGAGMLVLGVPASAEGTAGPLVPLLWIEQSGAIRIAVPAADMGQGVATALPLMLAEELDADWAKVRVIPFETGMAIPGGMKKGDFVAANSSSVRKWRDPMRRCGATARAMLVGAAAARWKVAPAACRTENGRVIHPDGKRMLDYGALAGAAAAVAPPSEVTFKEPSHYRLVGKLRDRPEVRPKCTGEAIYACDVRLPGMLFASARQGPVAGATLTGYDAAAAARVAGVRKVAAIGEGVALVAIATSTWSAMQALDAAAPTFALKQGADFDSDAHRTELESALDRAGRPFGVAGDAEGRLAAGKRVTATYHMPFLAHATMEPMSCVAWVHDGLCEIWAPTQVPFRAQDRVAAVLGIAPEKVTIRQTWLGGGFGRRAETDFIEQAALIARLVDVPVSLQWSRVEDTQHDYYRPAYAIRCEAALGQEGAIDAWRARIAGASIARSIRPEWVGKAPGWVDSTVQSALIPELYPCAATAADWVEVRPAVPVGYWRSVGHSQNVFAVESFIDELAHAAGADPYRFRRALLTDERARAVLDRAAAEAGWEKPLPPGRGRGIALVACYDSYLATVIEASADGGEVKVHSLLSVIDCGLTIHPDNVVAQVEGAAVFGLSAALYGEITFKNGAAQQESFADYRVLTLGDTPPMRTIVLPSTAKPGGVGETGTPPIAPALANALFRATGRRIRQLPIATALTGA